MRVRLFWQLLATFAVLIIFGIGATTALIGATYRSITTRATPATIKALEVTLAAQLADYYVAHGRSWAGVEERIEMALQAGRWSPASSVRYVLWDGRGQSIILQSMRDTQAGESSPSEPGSAMPIIVDGSVVGQFVLHQESWTPFGDSSHWGDWPSEAPISPLAPGQIEPPELVDRQVGRTFPLVAFGIGSITLGLAVIMSRRISAPLAALTSAARTVAAGDLQVRVPRSSILEVDALAQAFQQMAGDLSRADQLRRNMTADIAHELRTPLTIIKGKLEGVLDGVYPGTAEHIGPVLEEANLLERLVDDLRVLSLAEAGQLPLYREEVQVVDLLEDARRTFAREATQQQVTLHVDVKPDLPVIEVDPQRIQQVLGNLIANSLRHTPPGGVIELSAERQNGAINIAVRDTGSGIAPVDLPHIFDRFWRGDKARSRQGSGAGLGLAIARQLVEMEGGRINATSHPSRGTTITIDLPLSRTG